MKDLNGYLKKLNEFIGADLNIISGMDGGNEMGTTINTYNDEGIPASTTDNALSMSGQPSPWWYRYIGGSNQTASIKEEEIISKNNIEDLKNTFKQPSIYSKYISLREELSELKNDDNNTFYDILKLIVADLQSLKDEQTI